MQVTISREQVYEPAWHEPGNVLLQGVRSVYNRIPVNARLVAEYAMGRTRPITELDFSPAQLDAIRQQYTQHQQKNLENYAHTRSAQDALSLQNALQMDPIAAASGESSQDIYNRLRMKYENDALRYERNARIGRTPVSKYDAAGHIDEQNWGNVLSGLSDPNMQIGTTLGRYNVLEGPHGPMAYDLYDFDKRNTEKDESFGWEHVAHPVKGLDWALRKYGPQNAIPVQIMLGAQNVRTR